MPNVIDKKLIKSLKADQEKMDGIQRDPQAFLTYLHSKQAMQEWLKDFIQ
jgi:hypothetical protein